jgi:hypothetical protein
MFKGYVMKRCLFILILLTTCILFSQTWDSIVNSKLYYHGQVLFEDNIRNREEARDKALTRLSENISITVSSDFESKAIEKAKGTVFIFSSYFSRRGSEF